MQVSRVVLDEKTAYQFAKLQVALNNRSYQRTFDEVLTAAWYLVTQGAKPSWVDLSQEPTAIMDTFNFELINSGYEEKFFELKRRLSLGTDRATNTDTVVHVIKVMHAYYDQP